MDLTSRQILLKIDTSKKEDKIPLSLVAEKLRALQYLVYNVGTAKKGSTGSRGTFPTDVLQCCTLHFLNSKPGSLSIVAELPPKHVLSDELDIGVETLSDTVKTLKILSNGKTKSTLNSLYADRSQRLRIVKSALKLYPEEDSQYRIELTAMNDSSILQNETKDAVLDYLQAETDSLSEEIIKTVTGKLFLIEVETGDRKIGIIYNNREISCYYAPDLEQIICDLIPGTLVEVEGYVLFNEQGDIQKITDIIDIRSVQLNPLLWSRLDFGTRRYVFGRSITILQDYKSAFWAHECPELKILSYGKTRKESLDAFRETFDSLYQEIYLEKDDHLTNDAKELKSIFSELHISIEEL